LRKCTFSSSCIEDLSIYISMSILVAAATAADDDNDDTYMQSDKMKLILDSYFCLSSLE